MKNRRKMKRKITNIKKEVAEEGGNRTTNRRKKIGGRKEEGRGGLKVGVDEEELGILHGPSVLFNWIGLNAPLSIHWT